MFALNVPVQTRKEITFVNENRSLIQCGILCTFNLKGMLGDFERRKYAEEKAVQIATKSVNS